MYNKSKPDDPISYARITGPFKGSGYDPREENLKVLQQDGVDIYNANRPAIEKFIEQTINEKFKKVIK